MGEYGINPNLIAVMTGQKLEKIPPKPTAVNLPGKYGKLVAQNREKVSTSGINNYYRLQCGYCGKKEEYNLGTIAVDVEGIEKYQNSGEKNILDNIQASAYFRCKHCNGAGSWKLIGTSLVKFTFKLMTKMMFISNKKNQQPYKFIIGTILVDGDFKPHWGTDAEEHFLAKLAQDPQDAYRWNRLGNYFYQHDRAD